MTAPVMTPPTQPQYVATPSGYSGMPGAAQRSTALSQFRYTRALAAKRVAGAFNVNLGGFAEPPVGHVSFNGFGDANPVPAADPAAGTPIDPTAPITTPLPGASASSSTLDSMSTAMVALSLTQSALWGAGLGWLSSGDARGALTGAAGNLGVAGVGLALVGLVTGKNALALGAAALAVVAGGTAGWLAYSRRRGGKMKG
jgi:hypothetical protein